MLQTAKGTVAKDLLHKIGVGGYVKMVKTMVKTGKDHAPENWPEELRSVAEVTS